MQQLYPFHAGGTDPIEVTLRAATKANRFIKKWNGNLVVTRVEQHFYPSFWTNGGFYYDATTIVIGEAPVTITMEPDDLHDQQDKW